MNLDGREFREAWAVDFEYTAPDGEPPEPLCMIARQLGGGRVLRLWRNELLRLRRAPFATDGDSLLVAYYASAELGCFLALGWPLPENVMDLYAEFRNAERAALLVYCESDVSGVARLLERMGPDIDLPRALLRGRYMAAAARIERNGTPIDLPLLGKLRDKWDGIRDQLITRIDADYGVFDGRTFRAERWAAWISANGIPWPRLPSGGLALDDDSFREMARSHPAVAPIRELRVSLSQLRLEALAVGADGRNRCILSAFRSKTGRNQPSNTAFVFGPAVWLRSLIQADPGWAVAYIDWSQQEFGIAAALSGDAAMLAAYESGDPYMAFAKQAGAAPSDASRATHGAIREQFKACVLAVQYGMGADSLAARIGQAPIVARELLWKHREAYPTFWRWSQAAVDHAVLRGSLHTAFGWSIRTGREVNPRSLANFPMQANGAEMLRLACIGATERGVLVCAPVHDAILIEAPTRQIADAVREAQRAMADASAVVLGGVRLRTDAKIFAWPDRYADERGRRMWDSVQAALAELPDTERPAARRRMYLPHRDAPVQSTLSLSDTYPHARHTSRPAAAAETTGYETETVGAPAAAQAGRAVPQRADPVAVVVQDILSAGQGGHGRAGAVVSRRADETPDGEAISYGLAGAGRRSRSGEPGVDGAGAGRAGDGGATAGLLPDSDDTGLPDPVSDPDGWEYFAERAGIREFCGGQPREVAERAARVELAAWRLSTTAR